MTVKRVSFIVDPPQMGNRIFDFSPQNPVNRDNGVYPFFLLKQKLVERNIDISTQDILSEGDADLLLYLDMPRDLSKIPVLKKKYLILTESELIKPHNWVLKAHEAFEKIFTWNDDFVDNIKYFKLNFSNMIVSTVPGLAGRTHFSCLIAGAKSCDHPLELYSKRVETIRWFEKNHPEDFDLFGMGWDVYTFTGPLFIRAFNRVPFMRRAFAKKYPSYKGKVKSKFETLQKYRFSFCYENAQQISGYVTEKLFDAMFAGCIPVYWGAPNITDFVPAECFIDRRNFKDHEELYLFLKSRTDQEIIQQQECIYKFLNSAKVAPYSGESFASTLSGQID